MPPCNEIKLLPYRCAPFTRSLFCFEDGGRQRSAVCGSPDGGFHQWKRQHEFPDGPGFMGADGSHARGGWQFEAAACCERKLVEVYKREMQRNGRSFRRAFIGNAAAVKRDNALPHIHMVKRMLVRVILQRTGGGHPVIGSAHFIAQGFAFKIHPGKRGSRDNILRPAGERKPYPSIRPRLPQAVQKMAFPSVRMANSRPHLGQRYNIRCSPSAGFFAWKGTRVCACQAYSS